MMLSREYLGFKHKAVCLLPPHTDLLEYVLCLYLWLQLSHSNRLPSVAGRGGVVGLLFRGVQGRSVCTKISCVLNDCRSRQCHFLPMMYLIVKGPSLDYKASDMEDRSPFLFSHTVLQFPPLAIQGSGSGPSTKQPPGCHGLGWGGVLWLGWLSSFLAFLVTESAERAESLLKLT
jgi:hypothetical protein